MKTKTSHPLSLVFSTQINFSPKLQNFSFIKLHETNSSTLDCIHTFSSKYDEIHLTLERNMFLHDPTWKYHLMESCLNFLVFGRIFTLYTWNWLFNFFVKFLSFSIFSILIHMKSSKQVQKISKFTFDLPESFQHL